MNTAIKMNDDGDDIDSYGTGCDTLYLNFPAYTTPMSNEPWDGWLPAEVTPAFPYYLFWVPGSGNPYVWSNDAPTKCFYIRREPNKCWGLRSNNT